MTKKIISLLLLLIFTLVLTACGDSTSTYTYIINEDYEEFLVMGTTADYPPFEWPHVVDGKLTIVGIDIEIAKEIAKSQGKNLKVVNKHFDFLLEDLANGKVDFVMAGMTKTEAREQVVSFSIPYYNEGQALLINSSKIDSFTSFEDLNKSNIRIGAQLGSIQQEIVSELFPNSQHKFIKSVAELANNLNNNQIDALLVEIPVAQSYANNMANIVVSNINFEDNPDEGFGVAVAKENTTLLSDINDVLEELISSGKLDLIIQEMLELNS